jgi:cobalt-zinc-cadmium efflux system protein
MMMRQWYLADPIVSTIVGALVVYGAWRLVDESVDILLEGTPRHLNASKIREDLNGMNGVVSVHDLHIWSIASEITAMSCHLILKANEDANRALSEASRLMREKYGIEHTTIQMEFDDWADSPQLHHG